MLQEPKQLKLLNQLIQRQPDTKADALLVRHPGGDANEYQYQPKDAANVKAELIRRNLLSRKDLMQLYRPPLKKSQIPQNNPFTSKSMVEARNASTAAGHRQPELLLPAITRFNQAIVPSNTVSRP